MRICVIFNPAARGNKARHFRQHLDEIGGQSALKATVAPGDARRLALEAVDDGFTLIVAAGGDGTVNEVLNGIGDTPNGFERARLGVLPLGTINVFARELKIPLKLERAWEVFRRGNTVRMDLPRAEFLTNGRSERRYFAQLGGAGLDARAVELVNWQQKKKVGPLAYVVAGLKAMREEKPPITLHANGKCFNGELVLIGNGKRYGGSFEIFPQAELFDGRLDVCLFPRINWSTLFHGVRSVVTRNRLPEKIVQRFRATAVELTSRASVPFELDGERVGTLPATILVERKRLQVATP